MKLLTLNCHSWQEENPMGKLKDLARAIARNSYDVVALQEVSQSASAHHENYAKLLIEELHRLGHTDYTFVWDLSHFGYDIYEEGVAIVTKHPILQSESFIITENADPVCWKTRKIVQATIEFEQTPVSFFSCHLGWWHDEEEPAKEQIDHLLQRVNPSKLSFLMGDFNGDAAIRGESYDYLLAAGLHDTYELAQTKDQGFTVKGKIDGWDKNKKNLRIDYIFVNQLIHVQSTKIIFDGENEPVLSDHFGIEIIASLH